MEVNACEVSVQRSMHKRVGKRVLDSGRSQWHRVRSQRGHEALPVWCVRAHCACMQVCVWERGWEGGQVRAYMLDTPTDSAEELLELVCPELEVRHRI